MISKLRSEIKKYPKSYTAAAVVLALTLYGSPKDNPATKTQYFSTGRRPSGNVWWFPVAADPIAKVEDLAHHTSRGQQILAEVHKLTTAPTTVTADTQRQPTATPAEIQAAVNKLKAGPADHCFTYPSEVKYYQSLRVVVDGHTNDPTATLCLETDIARVSKLNGLPTAFMGVIVDPDYRQTVFASTALPQTFANESTAQCNQNTATLKQYGEILLKIEGGLPSDRWAPVEVMLPDEDHPNISNPICNVPSPARIHNRPANPVP